MNIDIVKRYKLYFNLYSFQENLNHNLISDTTVNS